MLFFLTQDLLYGIRHRKACPQCVVCLAFMRFKVVKPVVVMWFPCVSDGCLFVFLLLNVLLVIVMILDSIYAASLLVSVWFLSEFCKWDSPVSHFGYNCRRARL